MSDLQNKKLQIRGLNDPVEVSSSGYSWNGELDISPEVPPQVLIAIVEDMLTSAPAKERMHDSLIQFIAKNSRVALSLERQAKLTAQTNGQKPSNKPAKVA